MSWPKLTLPAPARSRGRCQCCGQPVWVLVVCACGHGVTAHGVAGHGVRCYAADANGPCGCKTLMVGDADG